MIIQIDVARPRRHPGLLALVRHHLARRFGRVPGRRRPQSVHGMSDHLRRDVGLAP